MVEKKHEKRKLENEKERRCYVTIVAFFSDNSYEIVIEHLRLFRVSELDCFPACASFEADFVDGTAHAFLNSAEPNFFDALFGIVLFESKFVEKSGRCISPTILLLIQVL